jgi:hypothetical protein
MSHVGDLWERLVCAAVERKEQALILIDDLLSALLDMSRPHLLFIDVALLCFRLY